MIQPHTWFWVTGDCRISNITYIAVASWRVILCSTNYRTDFCLFIRCKAKANIFYIFCSVLTCVDTAYTGAWILAFVINTGL